MFKPSTANVQPAAVTDVVTETVPRPESHRSVLKLDTGEPSSLSLALSLSKSDVVWQLLCFGLHGVLAIWPIQLATA